MLDNSDSPVAVCQCNNIELLDDDALNHDTRVIRIGAVIINVKLRRFRFPPFPARFSFLSHSTLGFRGRKSLRFGSRPSTLIDSAMTIRGKFMSYLHLEAIFRQQMSWELNILFWCCIGIKVGWIEVFQMKLSPPLLPRRGSRSTR